MSRRYDDHEEVATWLRDNIEQVVQYYCPDAKRRGSDLRWDDGRKSVKVTGARRGAFRPFNETDHALDPVGFVQWAIGKLHDPDGRMKAFDEARAVFGIGRAEGERLSEEERQRIREEAERKRAERAEQERKDQEEARAWARQRFLEAERIEGWQPYLNATRGLFLPQWPPCIRFHPACPTKPGGTTAPCILLALQGPWRTSDGQFANNAFMAVQRIYLSDDHAHKRDWKAAKLNYGPSSGALIHLTPLEQVGEDLGICEGLENGLSLHMMVGEKLPVWAATGTSNLSNAALPPQVKRVTIFADWDEQKTRQDGSTFRPGQDAAERLRDKCLAEGRAARIVYPNVFSPGEDWNDWIRRDQGELQRGEVTEQEIVEADEEFWTERVEATPFEQPAEAPETEAADNALQPADDGPPEGHPAAADSGPPPDWENLPVDPSAPAQKPRGSYGYSYNLEDASEWFSPDIADVQRHVVYIAPKNAFYDLETGDVLGKDAIDNLYRHRFNSQTGGLISHRLTGTNGTVKVSDFTYWPGKKQIVEDRVQGRQKQCVNRWQPHGLEPKEGDITPWNKLLDHIFGSDEEPRQRFEQWLAYHIQNPGGKIMWAPMLIGGQGIGKSTIGAIMATMLGEPNVRRVEPHELSRDFNEYMTSSQLLLLEEFGGVGASERAKLKGMITEPVVTVNSKNLRETVMPNRTNMLLFTNDPTPLAVETDDRRLMVYESEAQKNEDLMTEVYNWFRGEMIQVDQYGTKSYSYEGVRALMHRFQNLDMTGFYPLSAAPITKSKQTLKERGRSDMAQALEYLVEIDESKLRPDVVEPREVLEALKSHQPIPSSKISMGHLGSAMNELGWRRLQRAGERGSYVADKGAGTRGGNVTLWARRNYYLWLDRTPQERWDHKEHYKANPAQAEADRKWGRTADDYPWE